MLQSMTGFGRAEKKAEFGNIIVEIQSLNRRYQEVFISLPKEFFSFEMLIRKWVTEKILRGQIQVKIFVNLEDKIENFLPQKNKIKNLFENFQKIADDLKIDKKEISFPFLYEQAKLLFKDKEFNFKGLEKIFYQGVSEALDELLKMRMEEGKILQKDIEDRLDEISNSLKKIIERKDSAKETYFHRLQDQIKRLEIHLPDNEEKILREVALFAEKVDITEEIVRLSSHLEKMKEIFNQNEKVIGKKMDFIIQEMNREINTIGSKSQDSQISSYVIEVKSELEKIREQTQNIQ